MRVYGDGGQASYADKLYAQRLVQKGRCPISKKDDKLTCENYIVVVYILCAVSYRTKDRRLLQNIDDYQGGLFQHGKSMIGRLFSVKQLLEKS